jgi:hypothetical protein
MGLAGNGLRIAGWSTAALLLAAPLVAMQFTDEVAWTPSDFVFAAVMLAVAGGAIELGARVRNRLYLAAAAVAVATTFALVWISLAVGINGEGGPADLIYAGVLATGLVGAAAGRFRPDGMARAVAAAALAQVTAGAVSVIAGLGAAPQALGLSAILATAFLGAALLFRQAARERGCDTAS